MKVIVTGNSVSIISSIALEDIKTINKYRPEALILTEGNGKEKTPVFRICTGNTASMNENGVCFTAKTSDGKAVMTEIFSGISEKDTKEQVADKYGCGILRLKKLEESLPEVLKAIETQKSTIMNAIDVQ